MAPATRSVDCGTSRPPGVGAGGESTRSFAFDSLGASAAILDGSGTIVDTNTAWRLHAHLNDGPVRATGAGVDYLEVCDRAAAIGCADARLVAAGLRDVLAGRRVQFDLEYDCSSPGEQRWFLLQASAAPASASTGAVVLHIDITARKVLERGLAEQAGRDGLTGLANRSTANQHLADRMAAGEPVAVIFLDLDGFKDVNDGYGHHTGDELLVKVAARIEQEVGRDSHVARFGGDEFVVVVSVGTEGALARAEQVAEQIRDAVTRPFQIGAHQVSVGASLGVATSAEQPTAEGLVRVADDRMYLDKQRSSDRRRRLTGLVRALPRTGAAGAGDGVPGADGAEGTSAVGALASAGPVIEQLRASQALTEAVLANSADLVILFNADATIHWVSPPVTRLFGIEASALIGRNGFEIIHPDDQERVIGDFLDIPHLGDHVRTEFRIVIGDRTRWVEEIATNLLDEPNVGRIVGNLRDITARRVAEDAIVFQRTLLDAAGEAIVAYDVAGIVVYWNDAAEALYGWSSAEAVGTQAALLVPLAEGAVLPAAVASGRVDGESWKGALRVVTRSGGEVEVMVTSRPVLDGAGSRVATTMVSSDISGQRKDQESAARLSAIVASSSDAIFSMDGSGVITTWNEGAARLYGRPPEAAVGTHLATLQVTTAEGGLVACFDEIVRDGAPRRLITQGSDSAGRRFHVAVSMSPICVPSGAAVGISAIAQDITQRVEQRQREDDVRRRLADAQASARLGSFEIDVETGVVVRSQELCRIVGLPPDSLRGLEIGRVHPDDRAAVAAAWAATLGGAEEVSSTHRIIRPDGTTRWVLARSSCRESPGPRVVSGTVLDITERHEAELALAHQATHDPLTGLANRRLLVRALEASLEHSKATGRRTGVLFIDFDEFKVVNDRFGHVYGDEILLALGELLEGAADDGDTVARLGGDEYVVCCDDVSGVDELWARAERLHACLLPPFRLRGRSHSVTASIGLALSSPEAAAEGLLRNADAAMYAAKWAGGGRSELFDEALYAAQRQRQELAAELLVALDHGQIRTYFQPEVAVRTGSLVGFEALARWHHPERGEISPAGFLDVAESSGLIVQLGRQVLADGCRALASWLDRSPEQRLSVAINVSPLQLSDPTFPDDVREAIRAAGVPAGRVCLEVTESSLMALDVAADALRNLKAIGVTIAIDDFGTGYSSLSRLKRFPVDLLKIDRSFVDGLGADPEDEVIVATVINLARSLGIDVIAEGVETQVQLDTLATYGCELGQGFLWSPALPPEEAAALAAGRAPLRRATSAPKGLSSSSQQRAEATNTVALLVHELATPITVIAGYAAMARSLPGADASSTLDTALGAIERATSDMTNILGTMADARSVEEGTLVVDLHHVDVALLLTELVAERSLAGAGNPIALGPSDPVHAWIDPARTRQVFTNLLANADTWSPAGAPIEIHLVADATAVLVSVVDRGPGVANDRVGDLFRKFSRPDRTVTGTGLGLYLARQLARAQGGDIRYRRAEGGGSSFTVELPASAVADLTDPPGGSSPGPRVGPAS